MKKVPLKEVNKNTNTRVTNIHGSMEGQDILKLVESIEKEKDKQKKKEKKVKQKILEKELFYKCKEKCDCIGTCKVKGLKVCTVCHEIKRSVCSKASCVIDGEKPKMLTTATTTSRKLDCNDEADISESDEHDLEEESEVEGSEEDEDDGDDNVYADASKHL